MYSLSIKCYLEYFLSTKRNNACEIKVLAYYFGDTDSVFYFATDIPCYLW